MIAKFVDLTEVLQYVTSWYRLLQNEHFKNASSEKWLDLSLITEGSFIPPELVK